ncbi:DUF5685 family protein [Streptomyces avicenniae]|uniref:DUF5685 family protein n=1 Tax=Streptomyces avicenniae TaxID=500153 RepID=UPI0006996BD7|nr:DUF5685 family protein [Streptomyces avicenniae]
MFGIVRPCRHRLSEGLFGEWMGHLCGLCLALRGMRGQAARIATNYDGLLISVLFAAQAPAEARVRRTAGPCALRGMRTASVAADEGARLAAVVSLVLASAKLRDHVADGDGVFARPVLAGAARRVASGWDVAGARSGESVGFDTSVLVDAVARQPEVEGLAGPGTSVLAVTEPVETATAAAFAHTAQLAGRPGNAGPLAEAGGLFGRLAHLLDAVEDLEDDRRNGAWNPIDATGTPLPEIRRLCDEAVTGIRLALRDAEFTDDKLAHLLLAHEVGRSVDRAFGGHAHGGHTHAHGSGDTRTPLPPGLPDLPDFPGLPEPPGRRGKRRGFWSGCAMAAGLFCTCQICCAESYDGPWSGNERHGACHYAEPCGQCADCCQTCNCCGGGGGEGGGGCCDGCCCDGCSCDCNC